MSKSKRCLLVLPLNTNLMTFGHSRIKHDKDEVIAAFSAGAKVEHHCHPVNSRLRSILPSSSFAVPTR